MENRIRRLRKMQGLTLEKLGEKTGINITSLSHYETCSLFGPLAQLVRADGS